MRSSSQSWWFQLFSLTLFIVSSEGFAGSKPYEYFWTPTSPQSPAPAPTVPTPPRQAAVPPAPPKVTSKTSGKVTSRNIAAPDSFVKACGSSLCLGGATFFVKGHNLIPGRYVSQFLHSNDGEFWNAEVPYIFFNETLIDREIAHLQSTLGINTLRLFTPTESVFEPNVTWHGQVPWYLEDGSIHSQWLDRIKRILAICRNRGVKVQLGLFTHASEEVRTERIAPGSAKERRYFRYIESVASALKDEPALLSYEIGNEAMVTGANYWDVNGDNQHSAKVLSFITRMIRKVRASDPNHLIASGEVLISADGSWKAGSAETGMVPDIDGLNGGAPFTLAAQVDYLGSHLYGHDFDPRQPAAAQQLNNLAADVGPRIQSLLNRLNQLGLVRPIVFGEFGLMTVDQTIPMDLYTNYQHDFFQAVFAGIRAKSVAGAIVWVGLPPYKSAKAQTQITRWNLPGIPQSEAGVVNIPGRLPIYGTHPGFRLFEFDLADYPTNLLPAGRAYRDFNMTSTPPPPPPPSRPPPPEIKNPLAGSSISATHLITIKFTSVPGAAGYLVRMRNNKTNEVVLFDDNVPPNSSGAKIKLPVAVTPGNSYTFWVHTKRADFSYQNPDSYSGDRQVSFTVEPAPTPSCKVDPNQINVNSPDALIIEWSARADLCATDREYLACLFYVKHPTLPGAKENCEAWQRANGH